MRRHGCILLQFARNIAAVCDKGQKNGFLLLKDQSKYLSDR
ncbi:hypothetical protein AOX55_0000827 [Sinorhizobium fredii CCBAU 25509]|nr:hypothetical protein SF83666_c06060 [Sinorhizobium fredii CCBAU 83666]AWM24104.1 hypothetical protein AOX55_0000827 [Sinorhizobium fredii CCBAU 25509]